MTEEERNQALALAKSHMQDIERQMLELAKRKAQTQGYIESLGGSPEQDSLIALASRLPFERAEAISDRPGSSSRQLNRQIVSLAVEIIRAKGEPMMAPEIHLVHPMRNEFSTETLYRLMYNRFVSRTLLNLDGAFWPVNQPLPVGWEKVAATKLGEGKPGRKPKAKKKGETV